MFLFFSLFDSLPTFPSTFLSACLSACLPVCLSFCMSVCLSICLSICNFFTHGAPRSSQELVQKCPCIPGSNWNFEMLVVEERRTPEYSEKNLSRQSREPTTNSTHNAPPIFSICLSVFLFICLSCVCPPVYLVYLPAFFLSVFLSVCLSACLFCYLFFYDYVA